MHRCYLARFGDIPGRDVRERLRQGWFIDVRLMESFFILLPANESLLQETGKKLLTTTSKRFGICRFNKIRRRTLQHHTITHMLSHHSYQLCKIII